MNNKFFMYFLRLFPIIINYLEIIRTTSGSVSCSIESALCFSTYAYGQLYDIKERYFVENGSSNVFTFNATKYTEVKMINSTINVRTILSLVIVWFAFVNGDMECDLLLEVNYTLFP